jgi:hypothetical protein
MRSVADKGNVLLDHAVHQGKVFLQEFGEFYPYASVVKSNGAVAGYSLYAEEVSDIRVYADELERLLRQDLAEKKISGYCLGMNVRARLAGHNDIVDAIELRIVQELMPPGLYYLPYEKVDDEVQFMDIVLWQDEA